jgi:pimeloyl-ACP methyl ester carboxylesterase
MSDVNYYGRLAGDSYGSDDERPPLLLLHGFTYDRRQWGPVLDELRLIDEGRRVLAVDLPGHGDSPPSDSYSADEVVGAIHQAVVAAQIGDPIVVGHSLGGAVATTYAGRYPVRGVVNVDQPLLIGDFGKFLRGAESKRAVPPTERCGTRSSPGCGSTCCHRQRSTWSERQQHHGRISCWATGTTSW